MILYAFILGRKHMLSVAELINTIGNNAKIIDITPEALIAAFDVPITNPQICLDRLGGTIKIAEIFAEDSDKSHIAEQIGGYLTKTFGNSPAKLLYALSLYGFGPNPSEFMHDTLGHIKTCLTGSDLKSRFINKNFTNPETAALHGEKIIEKGAEVVAIQGRFKIFTGRTLAIQNIEYYTERDYKRPHRDPHMGMLPPKLAQIMINLTGSVSILHHFKTDQHLYDPFMGLGTVLAEAMLIGFSVIGSDLEPKVIDKTAKNLDWLRNQSSNSITPEQTFRVFCKDAASLTAADFPEKIDLVVTESYLGPPITKLPDPEEIKRIHSHVRETLIRFFGGLRHILATSTPVIICLPAYRTATGGHIHLEDLVNRISGNGFKVEPLIPRKFTGKFGLKKEDGTSLIYDRPDQIVGREIFKFVKTA
jgi:tRNA G10  N-methylase Trm11